MNVPVAKANRHILDDGVLGRALGNDVGRQIKMAKNAQFRASLGRLPDDKSLKSPIGDQETPRL